MAVKTKDNFESLLFLGVDVQEKGSIIVTYDKNMREEEETFQAHLVIYLQEIFGIIIWEVFSQE